MKHSFVSSENRGVLEFLCERTSGVSPASLKRLLKMREIKVNGKRIASDVELLAGDTVEVFIPAAFVRAETAIVYEDENILVAAKPPYTLVTGGLTEQLKDYLAKKNMDKNVAESVGAGVGVGDGADGSVDKGAGESAGESEGAIEGAGARDDNYLVPLHRLDVNTVGLVVFAKNPLSEEILLGEFKNRTIVKKYRALVRGEPKQGVHKAYLFKDEKKSISYVVDTPKAGYREIITECKTVRRFNLLAKGDREKNTLISEVELTLVTGRTHQLRAHLSHLGCPILGDDKYGDYELNKRLGLSLQQLAAVSIAFDKLPPPLENISQKTIALDFSFDDVLSKITH